VNDFCWIRESAGEPKITNFPNFTLQEDVGWLDITMNNKLLGKILTTLNELLKNRFEVSFFFLS
jgi:hypothetical protein